MAYTAADREALERALARGERRVTFGDKTVEYRSVDELRAALREVDAALAREAGRPKVRQIRVTTGKEL
ncbi:phage head-tail joining protein [Acidithiobacillus caldus]|jgi:putative IMPACT (imprinted ancient) family translation regulator|uniref:phage head-tail joining protein n=1 Tax=Acidithiobacillus caldus TaxID=33059 RepID=UPI001C07AEF5|nr:hypothetical protein [Acidithiobacillus caldus]MBU2763805.1 hypothetical protein [Acidithiobacillus caldus]MBU2769640.1 hypothetical protein [Acidithiobacillus caldus]